MQRYDCNILTETLEEHWGKKSWEKNPNNNWEGQKNKRGFKKRIRIGKVIFLNVYIHVK